MLIIDKIVIKFKKKFYFLNKIRFGKFEKDSYYLKPLIITGPKNIYIENNVVILKGVRMECYSNYAGVNLLPKLVIKKNTIIGYNFQCLVTCSCVIGENVLIASNVLITTENHGIDPTFPYVIQPLISGEVIIGNNCWIGEKCVILPGVSIGENTIIGAGSIVTKSIPSNCIAVGNPAKVVKKYDVNERIWKNV